MTVAELADALPAIALCERLGVAFKWADGRPIVSRSDWGKLSARQQKWLKSKRAAVVSLLTPDASGRAGVDYLRASTGGQHASLKPGTIDRIAELAADSRADPNMRAIAWSKLKEAGALTPPSRTAGKEWPIRVYYTKRRACWRWRADRNGVVVWSRGGFGSAAEANADAADWLRKGRAG